MPEPLTVFVCQHLPLGRATIERDAQGRQMLCIRLAALPVDGRIDIPLQDVLILAQDERAATSTMQEAPAAADPVSDDQAQGGRVGHA